MIRRLVALLVAMATAVPAWAAESTFARAYDLSTPTIAATTNRIVASVNLTNTTFTLAAQPDVPRNVTIAVTDTTPSITVGTITVTGFDVNGATITEVLDLSTALTLTGTKVFASVSSVVSAAAATLGGAGDETIIVGVGSVVGYIYCASSERTRGTANIYTTSSSVTVTASGGSPFSTLAVGDEIFVLVSGSELRRTIATKNGSGASITVDTAIDLSANSTTGYPFNYRHRACGTADTDGWIDIAGAIEKLVFIDVLALTATGGVDYSIECRGTADNLTPRRLLTGNIASAIVTAVPSTTFLPVVVTEPCASLRVGAKFGTVDTAGTESLSIFMRTK